MRRRRAHRTDYGGARRVLARRFAALAAAIAARFIAALARGHPQTPDAQKARRELIGDGVALDPIIDEAIGEPSEIREHSPALQAAVNGLFAALAGWRTVTVRLDRLSQPTACAEVDAVLGAVPQELRTVLEDDGSTRWMAARAACAAPWGRRHACSRPSRRERPRCGS